MSVQQPKEAVGCSVAKQQSDLAGRAAATAQAAGLGECRQLFDRFPGFISGPAQLIDFLEVQPELRARSEEIPLDHHPT